MKMRTRDKGEHGARVRLRNGIRQQARREDALVDQVNLGTVRAAPSLVRVEVAFDGSRNIVQCGWAWPERPTVGDRVVLVGLAGGQEWWVVAVVNSHPINALLTRMTAAEDRSAVNLAAIQSLDARVTALENAP